MTRGKFTRGTWQIDQRAANHVIADSRPICSVSFHSTMLPDGGSAENEANAALIAAAGTAATAAEKLGFDGQRAIEELPRLLEELYAAAEALGSTAAWVHESTDYKGTAQGIQVEADRATALLTACRVKEPSDDKH